MLNSLEIQKNTEEKRLLLGKKLEQFLLQKLSQIVSYSSSILKSKEAIFFGCFFIIAISVLARSTRDIGHDSATYLEVANKMLNGGKYYQDFFEINLPLPFLLTIIPVFLAKFFAINPIFIVEIFTDAVGIFMLYCSVKILQRSAIAKQRTLFNLLILSFAGAFFLRVFTLQFSEFATKTTYFLAIAFPYFCYNLLDESQLKKFDQIIIGLLAALIFCLKPNYGILVIVFELEKFWRRDLRSIFCLRNYITFLTLSAYIFLIIFCFPDYIKNFHLISSTYYESSSSLIKTIIKEDIFPIFLCGFLCKFLLKKNPFLLKFYLLSCAAMLIVISEFIGGYDQRFIIYSLSLPLLVTSIFLLIKNHHFDFPRYGILLIFILFLPQFDQKNIFDLALNLVVFWFLFVLFLRSQSSFNRLSITSRIFLPNDAISWLCFAAINLTLAAYSFIPQTAFLAWIISAILFILMIDFYQNSAAQKMSKLTAAAIVAVVSYFLALHLAALFNLPFHHRALQYKSPNHVNAEMIKVAKIYSANDEKVAIVSQLISGTYPSITYMKKSNELPFFQVPILFKKISEKTKNKTAENYLFSKLKQQLDDKNNKLFFVEIKNDIYNNQCQVGFLEYYLRDAEFRKIFVKNYRFLNRIIDRQINEEKVSFFADDLNLEFSKMIVRDIEVYVRR